MFSRKVFKHIQTLLMGSLLEVGRRTVCSAGRTVGLVELEKRFHKYHPVTADRLFSKAEWSAYNGSRILLNLLIDALIQDTDPLIFGVVVPHG
jgi:hypothetical protein